MSADTPEEASTLPTLDERIASLVEIGGSEFVGELVALFRDQRGLIDEASQASAAGDLEEVARLVHSLKSSAGNLSASALFEVCKGAEVAARTGDGASAARLVEQMPALFDAFLGEIEAKLASLALESGA